jgi:hypothetical protein
MDRFKALFNRNIKKTLTQEELLLFVLDEKTIDKAAKGSMQKRNELLKRVELKQKHA